MKCLRTILYVFYMVIIVCTDEKFFTTCLVSNGIRVCKSDEGLMSAFKIFILHAGHCDSSSFFPLKAAK